MKLRRLEKTSRAHTLPVAETRICEKRRTVLLVVIHFFFNNLTVIGLITIAVSNSLINLIVYANLSYQRSSESLVSGLVSVTTLTVVRVAVFNFRRAILCFYSVNKVKRCNSFTLFHWSPRVVYFERCDNLG